MKYFWVCGVPPKSSFWHNPQNAEDITKTFDRVCSPKDECIIICTMIAKCIQCNNFWHFLHPNLVKRLPNYMKYSPQKNLNNFQHVPKS